MFFILYHSCFSKLRCLKRSDFNFFWQGCVWRRLFLEKYFIADIGSTLHFGMPNKLVSLTFFIWSTWFVETMSRVSRNRRTNVIATCSMQIRQTREHVGFKFFYETPRTIVSSLVKKKKPGKKLENILYDMKQQSLCIRVLCTLILLFRRRRGASPELLRRQFQTIIMCSTSNTLNVYDHRATDPRRPVTVARPFNRRRRCRRRSIHPSRRRSSPVRFSVAYDGKQ